MRRRRQFHAGTSARPLGADARFRVVVAAGLAVLALLSVLVGRDVAAAWAADRAGGSQTSRLSADRFVDRIIDGESVSCMYGNVFIDRDTMTVAADTAFIYRARDLYEFSGKVRVTRDNSVLTCEHGLYDRNFGTADFQRNVRVVEGEVIGTGARGESRAQGRYLRLIGEALLVTPDYSVRADTIVQDRETGQGEAFGRVSIMEPGAENLVTGEHAVFLPDGEVAEVDRQPVLTSREQSGGVLTSEAGLMRFFRSEDRVVMVDSVRIKQGQTLALADTAVVYGRERMVLTGSPSVSLDGSSTMYGNRLEFFYAGGELRQLLISGAGRMEDTGPDSLARVYQGLPTMDILEGDTITVDFEDRQVRRSLVVGQAHSRYTPLDLTDEVATNDVTGDTIVIHFSRQKVSRVRVQGNADGTYRFARVAAMRGMLGKSKRLSDMLSRGGADSTSASDSLSAVVDSMAAAMGLSLDQVADGLVDSMLTVALDSMATAGYDTSLAGLDFLASAQDVKYGGQQVTFEMDDRTMEIEQGGRLDYGTMKLTATHIKLDTDNRELYAEGEPLVEDADSIAGKRMGYNFKHKSASVENGVTTFDNYYYVGDNIRRFGDQTMKICGGRMTSCDRAEPHYHFWSGEMKMRPGDKVVAAPIVLRVGRVPIFALPFYYKSLKEGRQSGILFPSFDFGWSSREGRYIRDFGYYWATNENLDFVFEGDYNERREFAYRVSNRYVKRYSLNGGIDYSRKIGLGEDNVKEWQLRWNHNQPTLWNDYKFRSDVKMASTSLSSNDLAGSNSRDLVSGQLKSSAYISRNWSWGNVNLNASRDERVNASDEDPASDNLIYSMTLPSFSLKFKQFTLAPTLRGGQKGSLVGNVLRNMYFQQGYSFRADTKGYENHQAKQYDANGNWQLSFRPPRLSIFNFSLSTNASQKWTRDEESGQTWSADTSYTDGGFYTDYDEFTEDTKPSLSLNAGLGTTLYGLFPLEIGRLKALRHTMGFKTTWKLTPGLPGHQTHGSRFGLVFDNRLDLKYLSANSDSTFEEKKLDGLLDWSLSSSYDPKAEPKKQWGDVSSQLTVKPGQSKYLKLKVTNTIDPYSLALKRTAFTYGLAFKGRLDVGEVPAEVEATRNSTLDRLGVEAKAAEDDTSRVDEFAAEFADENGNDPFADDEFMNGEDSSFDQFYNRPGRGQEKGGKDPTEGGRFIPFDFNTSLSYAYTNSTGDQRASANVSFNTQLTRSWEFRYTSSFDLAEGLPIRQQFSLNRDLHCWRLEFNRTVSAVDSQFGFRLYLKSIPALKFTRGREDNMGVASGGLGGGVF